jgi:CheY-like chemotaxis protein
MKQNLRPKTTKLSRQKRTYKKTSRRGHNLGFKLKLYRGMVAFFVGIFTLVFCYPLNKLEGDIANASPDLVNLNFAWDFNEAKAQEMAKWDVVVLDMENQVSNPEMMRKLKQLNPKIKILAYITSQEIRDDALGTMRTKLASGLKNEWYVNDLQKNRMSYWPGTHLLNVSDSCPVVDGQRFSDYLASFVAKEIFPTGLWDGVFYDNTWEGIDWYAGGKADLNLDGLPDSDIDTHWRNGYHALFNQTRQLVGNSFLIVGNIGPGHAQYATEMNGALIESFPEFGWTNAMRAYQAQFSQGSKPKYVMININIHDTQNKNDYKLMRFVSMNLTTQNILTY